MELIPSKRAKGVPRKKITVYSSSVVQEPSSELAELFLAVVTAAIIGVRRVRCLNHLAAKWILAPVCVCPVRMSNETLSFNFQASTTSSSTPRRLPAYQRARDDPIFATQQWNALTADNFRHS